MTIQTRTVEYAKEIDDVMDLLAGTIKTVREKGDYSSLVGKLVTAIDGMSDIDDEFENQAVALNTIGGRVGDLVDAFQTKKVVAETKEEEAQPVETVEEQA